MTGEEATELLRNNTWAKFADAWELLMEAAHIGAMRERERCAKLCESLVDRDDKSCDGAERCAAAIRNQR